MISQMSQIVIETDPFWCDESHTEYFSLFIGFWNITYRIFQFGFIRLLKHYIQNISVCFHTAFETLHTEYFSLFSYSFWNITYRIFPFVFIQPLKHYIQNISVCFHTAFKTFLKYITFHFISFLQVKINSNSYKILNTLYNWYLKHE